MTPANQTRLTLLAASKAGARLFRMNVGLAWVGKIIEKTATTITLKNPRPFKAGVEGMSDSVGLISVEITPEMVGQRLAIFCAVEDKSGSGRLTSEQSAFLQMVRASGGRAGVARTPDEAVAIVTGVTPLPLK